MYDKKVRTMVAFQDIMGSGSPGENMKAVSELIIMSYILTEFWKNTI